MSQDERKENLVVMRQIRKSDLPDLRLRKDYAGWVEANNDLKRRTARDPWFGVNDRVRDAIQMGEPQEKIDNLVALAKKLGGPPPDVEMNGKEFALHTEVYDIGISAARAARMVEEEMRLERVARGRAMMAERIKNEEKKKLEYEEDMQNPGLKEEKEAKERRERTMRRIMGELEEDRKKKRERAKEILGKYPDAPNSRHELMQNALKAAQDDVKNARRKKLGLGKKGGASLAGGGGPEDSSGESKSGGSAAKAREAAAAEAAGGRPRLPGDEDVTRGEIDDVVESLSSTVTGPLKVEVSSVYNKDQSDPPMRKHCFQYTIKITNSSPTDTIQLLGRRFEIQTVGSSMKDVVQGEGVTGRTPILKPGEVFEYTSTAPLSVRPIGTTIVAARMKGEYRYEILPEGQTETTATATATATDAVESGGSSSSSSNETAELGVFHFIFPEDQRVMPYRAEDEEEEEDYDDDDEEEEDEDEIAARATPLRGPIPPGGTSWGSCVRLVDPSNSCQSLDCVEMGRNEAALCCASVRFHTRGGESLLAVGTVTGMTLHPLKQVSSHVILYRVVDGERLQLLHKTTMNSAEGDGPVLAMAHFQGRLLVGIGKTLRLYEMGKRQLLRKCELKGLPTFVKTLQTAGDRVYFGDMMRSLHIVRYEAAANRLVLVANDPCPRPIVSQELLDFNTVAVGDKFGNISVLRLPRGTDTATVDLTGQRALWDTSSKIGSNIAKLETLCQYHVGEVVTSMTRSSLVAGVAESLIYVTVTGRIGALVPFNSREDVEFYSQLEEQLRTEAPRLTGRDPQSYRSYYAPVMHVIDGELCDSFINTLSSQQQAKIAERLDRSVGEIMKKLEDTRNSLL
mmetsp:Transcript_7257/g.14254  ORF Transcript_7257/g.14254 Transcript_7257/m.14254 type:complete len:854 (-) Transcript_7257:195-2756(-)